MYVISWFANVPKFEIMNLQYFFGLLFTEKKISLVKQENFGQ